MRSLLEFGDVDRIGEVDGDAVEADGIFFGVEGEGGIDALG